MCGIAGIICNNAHLVSGERVRQAGNCLRHRGPDGEGVWINHDGTAALGHTRLSIIDHSPNAGQPLAYLNRYHIIHNGELYNYVELRELLVHQGHRFTSQSDTEVIVAAYHEWGQACLEQFEGMFAFAIWDDIEKTFFAARDRFGEKPFFFFYENGQLIFASEIRAFRQMGIKTEVNRSLLYNFLTIGYTDNPGDPQETFYQQIHKLPAASFLRFSFAEPAPVIEKYWHLNTNIQMVPTEDAVHQFHDLLASSVKRRLRSEVSIGTSLSGGLDSSAIVAHCSMLAGDYYAHKCFTAVFPGFEKNEITYAAMVARQFGLTHYVTEIKDAAVVPLMQEVMRHQEEPFSSSSVLAQYRVFECARQEGVAVLLDGQGADEILAGYHKYYPWYWRELFLKGQLAKSKELEKARQAGVPESFGLKNRLAATLPEFTAAMQQSRKARQAFHHPDLDRDFAFENKRQCYYSLPAGMNLNAALFHHTVVHGLEELLRLADRNSMAHAVEVRLPFLDHHLVEYIFSLPPDVKIRDGHTKWLLRKSLEALLPAEVIWRNEKVGFEPPQMRWMGLKDVQEAIRAGKKKLAANHILQQSAAEKKIQPHSAYAAGQNDWKYWSASFLFD